MIEMMKIMSDIDTIYAVISFWMYLNLYSPIWQQDREHKQRHNTIKQNSKIREKKKKKMYNTAHNFNTESPLITELVERDNLWVNDDFR